MRDDLELVNLEFDTAFAQKGAFTTAVGLELLGILGLSEVPLSSVLIEACSAFFARGDVSEEVEIVIKEVWTERR